MIGQRLAPDFRRVVVAAPAYFERFGSPSHSNRLQNHCGVLIRIGDERVYRCEFERGDVQIAVDVPGSLLIEHGPVALPAVKQGAALMYIPDFMVAQPIKDGVLTTVLDDWAAAGAGLPHLLFEPPLFEPPSGVGGAEPLHRAGAGDAAAWAIILWSMNFSQRLV